MKISNLPLRIIQSEKPVKTNKLSEKVSPETELISDSNASFKDLSKGLSDNTIPVTMKTVDDTLLSPESSENKSTANSNGQSMLSSVTRLFKKSSTPVSFSSDSQGLKDLLQFQYLLLLILNQQIVSTKMKKMIIG